MIILKQPHHSTHLKMRVDPPGFEPGGASALQGQRSPSLSYGPITKEDKKIAPPTLTNESGSVDDYSV